MPRNTTLLTNIIKIFVLLLFVFNTASFAAVSGNPKFAFNFGTCKGLVVDKAKNYGSETIVTTSFDSDITSEPGVFDQALKVPEDKHFIAGKVNIENPFTLSFWFKPEGYSSSYNSTILTTNDTFSSIYSSFIQHYGLSIRLTNGANVNFIGTFVNSKHKTRFNVDAPTDSSSYIDLTACSNNCPWLFIAVSYDGVNSPTLYFSKESASDLATKTYTMSTPGKSIRGSGELRFGMHPSNTANDIAYYDEVRVFDRKLSKADILALKNRQKGGRIDISGLSDTKSCRPLLAFNFGTCVGLNDIDKVKTMEKTVQVQALIVVLKWHLESLTKH